MHRRGRVKMENFETIVNGWKLFIILAYPSILDIRKGPGYKFAQFPVPARPELNVHKIFIWSPGRLMNSLGMFGFGCTLLVAICISFKQKWFENNLICQLLRLVRDSHT